MVLERIMILLVSVNHVILLRQLVLCEKRQNMSVVEIRNNHHQEKAHVVLTKIINDRTKYEQNIPPKNTVKVVLRGNLGTAWSLQVEGQEGKQSTLQTFGYANGTYTIDTDGNTISSAPLSCKVYEDLYPQFDKVNLIHVDFSADGKRHTTHQTKGERSLVITNKDVYILRAEIKFYNHNNPSQTHRTDLILQQGEPKTLSFSDSEFLKKAQAVATLDRLTCSITFREYGKVLSGP